VQRGGWADELKEKGKGIIVRKGIVVLCSRLIMALQ
jgi:hypothetical protein